MLLTADAIHNWTAPYVQKRYAALPQAVKDAARAAMVRHHQKGTDARDEAETLNQQYRLGQGPADK